MKKQIVKSSIYYIEEESGQITAHYSEVKDENGKSTDKIKFKRNGKTLCTIEDGGTNFEYKRGNQTLILNAGVLADLLTAFVILQYGEGRNIHHSRLYGEKGKFKIKSNYE
jgi:hypothetical protein